jgi:hypothetical protein
LPLGFFLLLFLSLFLLLGSVLGLILLTTAAPSRGLIATTAQCRAYDAQEDKQRDEP